MYLHLYVKKQQSTFQKIYADFLLAPLLMLLKNAVGDF